LPNDVLHVDGASAFIRVNRTDGEAGITLMYNGSNTTRSNIATQTNGDLAIDTANAERMRITSSGNVGIGTQNPYGVTHWQKASTVNLVATNSGADGQADATVMSLIGQARGYSNNLAKLASIDFKTDPTTWYYGAMTFNVANLDGTDTSRTPLEAMRINRLGQVGIGTTSPSLPLTIVGDDGDPASSGATAVGALQIQQGTNDVVLEAGVKANSNRYAWLQSTNKVSHTAYNMALNPNGGNVGIGRTSPQSRLDVLSSARITSSANTSHAFKLEARAGFANDGNSSCIWVSDGGSSSDPLFSSQGAHLVIECRQSAGRHIYFKVGNTTTAQHIMSSDGRMGIGTTSPSERLHVSGNILASGSVTQNSDISLKDNITPIPNALDKVLQIRGVTYNRNDIEDNPRDAGVIAQEVERVLPEVVSQCENGIKSVAYGNMVGLLIEAIRELSAEIEDLKSQNNL
jgi:hypothetical protein